MAPATRDIADVYVTPSDSDPEIAQQLVLPATLEEYLSLWTALEDLRREDAKAWRQAMRVWTAGDLFFLLSFVLSPASGAKNPYLGVPHFWHPVILWYCRAVQLDSNGVVNIASRGLGKSTIQTMAFNIQGRLRDPNSTSCIFSHSREFANKHLRRIGDELRGNAILKDVWSDRVWADVDEAPATWSATAGFCLRRDTNRPEMSFEAHAFQARLPAGMHYSELHFDDIETDTSVANDEAMALVRDRFISAQDLVENALSPRYITGTIYHPNGAMLWLHEEMGYRLRVLACEDMTRIAPAGEGGPLGGTPVFFTRKQLFDIYAKKGGTAHGRRSYAMQVACQPIAGEEMRLHRSHLDWYDGSPREVAKDQGLYVVICVDPSLGQDDPTFVWVWGLRHDKKLFWLDALRARLAPRERMEAIYQITQLWDRLTHTVMQLRIEQYGQNEAAVQQRDFNKERGLAHIPVVECHHTRQGEATSRVVASDAKKGGGKITRIYNRWEPALSVGDVAFPRAGITGLDKHGERINLVEWFIEQELSQFPMSPTDDGLDAAGLIWEPVHLVGQLPWPPKVNRRKRQEATGGGTYMSEGLL